MRRLALGHESGVHLHECEGTKVFPQIFFVPFVPFVVIFSGKKGSVHLHECDGYVARNAAYSNASCCSAKEA